MSAAEPQPVRASEVQHRRETRNQILLPLALAFLLILGGMVLVFVMPRRLQVGLISDLMLTVLILCPAALCLLPVTIGLLVAAFGMNRVHDAAARPLRRLEDLSLQLSEGTESTTEKINQSTINVSARMGGLYRLIGVFESDKDDEQDE